MLANVTTLYPHASLRKVLVLLAVLGPMLSVMLLPKWLDEGWRHPSDGLDEISLIGAKIQIVTALNAVAALVAWYSG